MKMNFDGLVKSCRKPEFVIPVGRAERIERQEVDRKRESRNFNRSEKPRDPGFHRGDDCLHDHQNWRTCKKSVSRPKTIKSRPGVRVEPHEFTSNGGKGEALPAREKSFFGFYEVIKIDP